MRATASRVACGRTDSSVATEARDLEVRPVERAKSKLAGSERRTDVRETRLSGIRVPQESGQLPLQGQVEHFLPTGIQEGPSVIDTISLTKLRLIAHLSLKHLDLFREIQFSMNKVASCLTQQLQERYSKLEWVRRYAIGN